MESIFINFTAGLSAKAAQRRCARRCGVGGCTCSSDKAIDDLSRMFNPVIRGLGATTTGVSTARCSTQYSRHTRSLTDPVGDAEIQDSSHGIGAGQRTGSRASRGSEPESVCPLADRRAKRGFDDGSRMSREVHVRFCEGLGVRFPRATHHVVLCHSREQALQALEKIQEFANANGLTLHPEKTQIVDASQPGGFDFLGYHFERGMKWPRKKSLAKLKEVLRAKTRRTEGRSIKAICEDLNGLLHGWFEYFKHSKSNVFTTIDGYTRGRLRSILRKRRGGRGRGRGRDHQRWSNDFFHAQGLISLSQCLRAIRQSP